MEGSSGKLMGFLWSSACVAVACAGEESHEVEQAAT